MGGYRGTDRYTPAASGPMRRTFLLLLMLAAVLLPSAAPAPAWAVGDCVIAAGWPSPNTSLAAQVVQLVNQHRTDRPRDAERLADADGRGRWKASHMAEYGYMAHDDPAPPVARSWVERIAACGYTSNSTRGENVAYGFQSPQASWTPG